MVNAPPVEFENKDQMLTDLTDLLVAHGSNSKEVRSLIGGVRASHPEWQEVAAMAVELRQAYEFEKDGKEPIRHMASRDRELETRRTARWWNYLASFSGLSQWAFIGVPCIFMTLIATFTYSQWQTANRSDQVIETLNTTQDGNYKKLNKKIDGSMQEFHRASLEQKGNYEELDRKIDEKMKEVYMAVLKSRNVSLATQISADGKQMTCYVPIKIPLKDNGEVDFDIAAGKLKFMRSSMDVRVNNPNTSVTGTLNMATVFHGGDSDFSLAEMVFALVKAEKAEIKAKKGKDRIKSEGRP